jgi:hypothetical protein
MQVGGSLDLQAAAERVAATQQHLALIAQEGWEVQGRMESLAAFITGYEASHQVCVCACVCASMCVCAIWVHSSTATRYHPNRLIAPCVRLVCNLGLTHPYHPYSHMPMLTLILVTTGYIHHQLQVIIPPG